MKIVILALLACCVFASRSLAEGKAYRFGAWPEDWPKELEPLRQQSQTTTIGLASVLRHEIRFNNREQLEAAWPYLLQIRSKGAPIVLFKGTGEMHLQSPSSSDASYRSPVNQNANARVARRRWLNATYIELHVDGRIVDLNRIKLPADAPIVDKRFRKLPKNSDDTATDM